jgi:hypothetical protein
MPAAPVKPEFRPTLPQLLGPRLRASLAARLAVAALAALVAGALVWALFFAGYDQIVVREPLTFNLYRADALKRLDPRPGELLRLESRRGDLFLQSYVVRPLRLAPYRGEPGGAMPLRAERLLAARRGRVPDFELLLEGRARIGDDPGYELLWRGRLTPGGRRVFGRDVLVLPDRRGVRDGVLIELRATPASGVVTAADLGYIGPSKVALRSFRFGTANDF